MSGRSDPAKLNTMDKEGPMAGTLWKVGANVNIALLMKLMTWGLETPLLSKAGDRLILKLFPLFLIFILFSSFPILSAELLMRVFSKFPAVVHRV